ncbi:hypothetical protein [Methylobacterium sp. A52T]
MLYLGVPHRASACSESGCGVPARPRPVPPRGRDGAHRRVRGEARDDGVSRPERCQKDGAVHHGSRTVDRRAAARIKQRETELDAPGALVQAKVEDPTLGAAIDRYIVESRRTITRTKAQVLQAIKGYPLAALPCSAVTRAEITAFIAELGKGRDPSTVANDLSHLSAVTTSGRRAGAGRSIRRR